MVQSVNGTPQNTLAGRGGWETRRVLQEDGAGFYTWFCSDFSELFSPPCTRQYPQATSDGIQVLLNNKLISGERSNARSDGGS